MQFLKTTYIQAVARRTQRLAAKLLRSGIIQMKKERDFTDILEYKTIRKKQCRTVEGVDKS